MPRTCNIFLRRSTDLFQDKAGKVLRIRRSCPPLLSLHVPWQGWTNQPGVFPESMFITGKRKSKQFQHVIWKVKIWLKWDRNWAIPSRNGLFTSWSSINIRGLLGFAYKYFMYYHLLVPLTMFPGSIWNVRHVGPIHCQLLHRIKDRTATWL